MIDCSKGEMFFLLIFWLPTLIYICSANVKWFYELSHKNFIWIYFSDVVRIGVVIGDLICIEIEIGLMVDSVWVIEGIKFGIIVISHYLGCWCLKEFEGVG